MKILRVDPVERKIGLSKKRAEWSVEQDAESAGEQPIKVRRGGLDSDVGDSSALVQPVPGMRQPRPNTVQEPRDEPTDDEGDLAIVKESADQGSAGADSATGPADDAAVEAEKE